MTDNDIGDYFAKYPHDQREALNIIAAALSGIRYDLGAIRELLQDRR